MKVQKEAVQKLKSETKSNPAVNAVFYLLALRERNRSTLTLGALTQRMKEEGFNYSRDQYRDVLSKFAKHGIGAPVYNKRGNCVAIKDIVVGLSELGRAALDAKEVSAIEQGVVHKRRVSDKAPQIKPADTVGALPVTKIEVAMDGKPITIQCPAGMSAVEMVRLVERLQAKGL